MWRISTAISGTMRAAVTRHHPSFQAGSGLPKRERGVIRSGHLYHQRLRSSAWPEDEQRHAADEREPTHDGRQWDRLLLLLRGRDRTNLEHLLPPRVGDPLVCERDDTEHDQQHRDDLDPRHRSLPARLKGNQRAGLAPYSRVSPRQLPAVGRLEPRSFYQGGITRFGKAPRSRARMTGGKHRWRGGTRLA